MPISLATRSYVAREALSPTMASTGSIGMMRPMKKVTQVSPRKVSATEDNMLATRRMGRATRKTHPSFVIAAVVAVALTPTVSGLRDRPEEVEVLDNARLV